MPNQPTVAVLLAAFEDHRFLSSQLASIHSQTHERCEVWVSRDCETEAISHILARHESLFGADLFHVVVGPRAGLVRNFLSLLGRAEVHGDYYAFADQDDVWEPDKLARAVALLAGLPDDVPAVYCSRTRLIDAHGRDLGLSPLCDKPPGFTHALVQNISGGNTMVMNGPARALVRRAGPRDVPYHDWWTYLLVTGAGGVVRYDPYPSVRYRQHDRNDLGTNKGCRGRAAGVRRLLDGTVRECITANVRALRDMHEMLTLENRRLLDRFCAAREHRLIARVRGIWTSGVYRQRGSGTLELLVAALLRKL